LAGKRPTPANRRRRTSGIAGVGVFYSRWSGRIRPATTRGSEPRWSLSGFSARPMGGRQLDPDFAFRQAPAGEADRIEG
jgi:hypothetical protein